MEAKKLRDRELFVEQLNDTALETLNKWFKDKEIKGAEKIVEMLKPRFCLNNYRVNYCGECECCKDIDKRLADFRKESEGKE